MEGFVQLGIVISSSAAQHICGPARPRDKTPKPLNNLAATLPPDLKMASSFTGKQYPIYRGQGGAVVRDTATIPELGPDDVLIRITHSGVCFTDQEFYRLGSPVALGHEGTGVVEAIGSSVTTLKVGDRAGGGFHRHSCGKCHYCLTGQDIFCYERTVFGFGDYNNGTFGQYYLGKETYVHRIPDGLSSEDSAPLHCAGATVYSALTDTVKERDRLGIIGIGGLGHLAIQFAAKMGVEVVVFSSSADKEAEARAFGASEFVLLSEPEKISAPVDVLILAGSKYPDWTRCVVSLVLWWR